MVFYSSFLPQTNYKVWRTYGRPEQYGNGLLLSPCSQWDPEPSPFSPSLLLWQQLVPWPIVGSPHGQAVNDPDASSVWLDRELPRCFGVQRRGSGETCPPRPCSSCLMSQDATAHVKLSVFLSPVAQLRHWVWLCRSCGQSTAWHEELSRELSVGAQVQILKPQNLNS